MKEELNRRDAEAQSEREGIRRVRLEGSSIRLTREEWDEIEMALGAAVGPNVSRVVLVRDYRNKAVGVFLMTSPNSPEPCSSSASPRRGGESQLTPNHGSSPSFTPKSLANNE
jgi:hypothetical protein